MPFTRPTLSQIRDRIEADFKSSLGLTTILQRSFLKAFGTALAGASHLAHGAIVWALKQLLPDSAEDAYLIRWANIFRINRNPATHAEIEILVTGSNGTVVPTTTFYQRSDGEQYQVKTEMTVAGGQVLLRLVSVNAGSALNMANGDSLSLTSPIAGLSSTGVVQQTFVEGEDQETIEDLRVRLLERIQNPPAGGTVADYIAFAKTVTGVTRVWVLPAFYGQGTIGLTFVEDNENPIIPSQPKVDEVQAAVLELQPVTADTIVFAPTASPINPVINIKPNTAEIRAAVEAELTDLIFREAQVRDAVDPALVGEGVQFTGKLPISKINEAISIAVGEDDHELVSPLTAPQPPTGGILTLGTITFGTLP